MSTQPEPALLFSFFFTKKLYGMVSAPYNLFFLMQGADNQDTKSLQKMSGDFLKMSSDFIRNVK